MYDDGLGAGDAFSLSFPFTRPLQHDDTHDTFLYEKAAPTAPVHPSRTTIFFLFSTFFFFLLCHVTGMYYDGWRRSYAWPVGLCLLFFFSQEPRGWDFVKSTYMVSSKVLDVANITVTLTLELSTELTLGNYPCSRISESALPNPVTNSENCLLGTTHPSKKFYFFVSLSTPRRRRNMQMAAAYVALENARTRTPAESRLVLLILVSFSRRYPLPAFDSVQLELLFAPGRT